MSMQGPPKGRDRSKRYGPRFNPKKNVPIPVLKPKYGKEVKINASMQNLGIPMLEKSQTMSVYDYLDTSSLGLLDSADTVFGQRISDVKLSKMQEKIDSKYFPQSSARGGVGGFVGDSQPGSGVNSRAGTPAPDLASRGERASSPSSLNAGVSAADFQSMTGMTRWEMNQRILQENWQVIQNWEKQARERGSLVGLSYEGRKLQKIQPSKRVRILGVDDPEPIEPMPSLESMGLQRVAATAKYANLSGWQMGFNNANNKLAHLRCVQSIIVREGLILQLDQLLCTIEKHYYEYALLRLQSADLGLPTNTEQLVVKKAKIADTQCELRVALANYRTSTLMVFEEFLKWRAICRKDVNIKDAGIILMWHGENYLLKMTHDVAFLYRYSVLRLWLEFEPNMLMLPPSQIAASNTFISNSLSETGTRLQEMGADVSVTSNITGENPNDSFFNLPGMLVPLTAVAEDDLMSQVSDVSVQHWRSFYEKKYELYSEWTTRHEAFLKSSRQDFLKRRRVEEKEEREAQAARDMVEYEVKRKRADRANQRFQQEEKAKREKNFKILKIHQVRVDAGEDPEVVKTTKSKEEIELDRLEEEEKRNADAIERKLQITEAEEKAARDEAFKNEKLEKYRAMLKAEEDRFESGINKVLTDGEDNIAQSKPLNDADGVKEWQTLRNICLASWKCTETEDKTILADGSINYFGYNDGEPKMIWEQHPEKAPVFWANNEISPLVCEAAIGFKDLWPRDASLVPPLPEKLFRKCSEYRRFLEMEKRKLSKLKQQCSDGENLRKTVDGLPSLVYFDEKGLCEDPTQSTGSLALRFDDEDDVSEVTRMRLKTRQQSDACLVNGSLRIYQDIANLDPSKTGLQGMKMLRSKSSDGRYQLLKFKTVTKTASTDDIFSNKVDIETGASPYKGEEFFAMTATEEEYEEGYTNDKPLIENGDANGQDFDPMYNRTLTLQDTQSSAHFTGLDSVKTKPLDHSQKVVLKERQLVEKDSFGITMIRPEQQHRRPPDYTRPYWQNKLAQRIQACMRGALVRTRKQRAEEKLQYMNSVLKIQRQVRRRIGVRLYQKKKEAFQSEIEELRKDILMKYHMAIRITKFIRWCGAVNIGEVAMNPMLAYAQAAAKSRRLARERRVKRAAEYSQNATDATSDGLSLIVRTRRDTGRDSPASSPPHSRNPSRGTSRRSRGSSSPEQGQAEPGEFGETDNSNISEKKNVKLANIFKAETRSGSRLIPITVKPGSRAAQPGTSKPRFRPFAARLREFVQDVHRPKPERTVQHPNDCYRPPPALLSKKEREVIAKELAAREAIAHEDGVEIINKRKLEKLKLTVKSAILRRSPPTSVPSTPPQMPQTEGG